jgi:penicillin-binding protein 1A
MHRCSKVVMGTLLVGACTVFVAGMWFQRTILDTLPSDLSAYRGFRPPTTVRLYAADGTWVDRFYVERRVWVSLASLPDHVGEAFVAAEDRRFYEHQGVDLFGIARALHTNFVTGDTVQGASTLTQQLVKNLIVGRERSYDRKIREAVLAWRLERELDKSALLELYINFVALGNGNYGVEAASQDYFGVSARDIDVGQAALLAGLVPAPSRYSPRRRPEVAAERRRLVLRAMIEEGMLTTEETQVFLDAPVLVPREGTADELAARAYVTEARRQIRARFGDQRPFSEGFEVHLPLNLSLQKVAEQSLRKAIVAHMDRQGTLLQKELALPELEGDHVAGDCFDAVVGSRGKLRAGSWEGELLREDRALMVRLGVDGEPMPLLNVWRAGRVVPVCLDEKGVARLATKPWAQGAVVVLENATGRVLTLVGGYRDTLEGYVRATQARRQPGSSFKPFLYATALSEGRNQLDTVVDGPISLPAGNGKTWSPQNYSGGYAGKVTLRSALARSLNTVAVRLALDVGIDDVATLARRMGVATPLRQDLTLSLGSSEVTPMDQARGFMTVARLGHATPVLWFDKILDVWGRPVQDPLGEKAPVEPVLEPGVAYELADMMEGVVREGTARKAFVEGRFRAGKTGTTNDFRDAWFVGFTPQHTVAVWIGTDGTVSLGEQETGGRSALPVWIEVVEALGEDGSRLPVPAETVFVPHEGAWRPVVRAEAVAASVIVPEG